MREEGCCVWWLIIEGEVEYAGPIGLGLGANSPSSPCHFRPSSIQTSPILFIPSTPSIPSIKYSSHLQPRYLTYSPVFALAMAAADVRDMLDLPAEGQPRPHKKQKVVEKRPGALLPIQSPV